MMDLDEYELFVDTLLRAIKVEKMTDGNVGNICFIFRINRDEYKREWIQND